MLPTQQIGFVRFTDSEYQCVAGHKASCSKTRDTWCSSTAKPHLTLTLYGHRIFSNTCENMCKNCEGGPSDTFQGTLRVWVKSRGPSTPKTLKVTRHMECFTYPLDRYTVYFTYSSGEEVTDNSWKGEGPYDKLTNNKLGVWIVKVLSGKIVKFKQADRLFWLGQLVTVHTSFKCERWHLLLFFFLSFKDKILSNRHFAEPRSEMAIFQCCVSNCN